MINLSNCEVEFVLRPDDHLTKAQVTFWSPDHKVRLSGFKVKSGRFGLYLEEPRISYKGKWPSLYYDTDKRRWKELGKKVVELYEEKAQSATTKEIDPLEKVDLGGPETIEINIDDIPF